MEENRILLDYMIPTVTEHQSAIRKPTINAAHFELKPGTLQMIQNSQFGGLPSEDPKEHVANFLEVCDTFCQNVSEEAVRLRSFPFSLRDRAKNWLNSLSDYHMGGSLSEIACKILSTREDYKVEE